MEQPGLNFVARDQDAATRLQGAFLEAIKDGAWHKGRELCTTLQTNERVIRRIADRSAGEVISGELGYRLIEFASRREINRAVARLLSQANKMRERAVEIRKARNAGRAVA